jgi:sugar lactone lactonase YvrE
MKKIILPALVALAMSACSEEKKTDNSTATDTTTTNATASAAELTSSAPSLQKVWETDTVLTTVESTLYDAKSGTIYTSNIEGGPTNKDGKGSISKLKPDGTIAEVKWVTGLHAPKGMAILNDKLYVTDIDELVEINLADGKIAKRYPVKGAKFLNDAATDGSKVYFTDMNTGKVHVLEGGKVNTVAEGRENINGLAFDQKGGLYFLDGKGLGQYNMQDKKTSFVNEVVTGGDGLVVIDDSTYIASRWKGEIYLVKNGKEHLLLDTSGESSNTADIDYIKEEKLVLVPTFMKNKVVAYKLNY